MSTPVLISKSSPLSVPLFEHSVSLENHRRHQIFLSSYSSPPGGVMAGGRGGDRGGGQERSSTLKAFTSVWGCFLMHTPTYG